MSLTPVADQAQRDRLRHDLDATLFVEAGAGTGKTTAVVSRIVALVGAGRLRMERLVAITFTIAAAGELRVRIREGLEAAVVDAGDPAEAESLREAAGEVDRARIETIHAFCSTLLRMHPFEAGLPPAIETLTDLAASLDVRERFRRWFDALTPTTRTGESVRRALLLGMRPDTLLALFTTLNENWDLVAEATWTPTPVAALSAALRLADEVDDCIALLRHCWNPDDLHGVVSGFHTVSARLRDADTEDAALSALVALQRTPRLGNTGSVMNWSAVDGVNACTTIRATMQVARESAEALLEEARAAALSAIGTELRDQILLYAEERRERGIVSYQDLLVRARNLVRDHSDVREALHQRWDFVTVDEFQDTDPLQAELALRLCASIADPATPWTGLRPAPGRLCLVGDPKQSIYRFRRADIALYSAVEESLLADDPAARVRLSVNFRSGRRIIDVVNGVFGGPTGLMANGGGPGIQAHYVPLAPHAPEIDGSVGIVGGELDVPAAQMWREEAQTAAALVRRMLSEPWMVGEGTAAGSRPCRPEDICVLMPSRANLRRLERELEEVRVPYRLESGSLIVATQEVRDLLNILRSIDDPTDEVALVAALRTPAFGCSDVELLQWRSAGGRWSYEWPGAASGPERVASALAALHQLREGRLEMSVPRLIDEILATRLLRALAFDDWRPRETRRRYRFVAEHARALAASGRPTLHDAVEYLERLARDPVFDSVASDAEADEQCVRIMTVHAAKGLEFPVVLITGLGRKPSSYRPLIVADRINGNVELRLDKEFKTPGWDVLDAREKQMEDAERARLLYVAMTRARDHLVVGLFRTRRGGDATEAGALDARLRGRADVVALDISQAPPPLSQTSAGPDPQTPEAHWEAEEVWFEQRQRVLSTLAAVPTLTATGIAHAENEDGLDVGRDVASSRRGRAGTALGRAVHAVLQVIDLQSGALVEPLSAAAATAEGVPERSSEIARLVDAVLRTDALQLAARSRHWREVPLGAPIEGIVVEGFVDLLYELPDGRLVVVDYKTDDVRGAGIDVRMERYALQGGVYALLVAETTKREVARIEFVFAAAGVTRTITDVTGVVTEVRRAPMASSPVKP